MKPQPVKAYKPGFTLIPGVQAYRAISEAPEFQNAEFKNIHGRTREDRGLNQAQLCCEQGMGAIPSNSPIRFDVVDNAPLETFFQAGLLRDSETKGTVSSAEEC
ncbi:hypothetical protein CVT25_007066 [Psilocybe cyanescens]|uniref:Uncharacterized protein n=1 Tax=Psilocybe cyanescens TaxID=93625 RepID=A0A409WY84_PSICY|nr:hypothetical protein CVT25_007066 [Psilocybe cyanescens]